MPTSTHTMTDAPETWRRSLWLWAAVVSVTCTIGGIVGWRATEGGSRFLLVGAASATALCFVTLGRTAALRYSTLLVDIFLSLSTLFLAAVVVATPNATAGLFLVLPLVWLLTPSPGKGVAWSAVVMLVAFLAILTHPEVDRLRAAGVMAAGLAFSALLGGWIASLRRRSGERAILLIRLERAQTALSLAHHEEGVMVERERMSREIHDTLAQGFLSIMAQARAAAGEVRRAATVAGEPLTPETVAELPAMGRLRQIEATARENLAESRSLVAALAPVGLDEVGLREALDRLGTRFAAETGIALDFDLGAEPDTTLAGLPRPLEVVVVRAVQEALTNIRRHAQASAITLACYRPVPGRLELTIADDGIGIAPNTRPGFGLAGLRERVELIGGTVELEQPPQGGTTVRISLPTAVSVVA